MTKEKELHFLIFMSGRDVYPRLNALEPCFLKKAAILYAKANGMYTGALENSPGEELLCLKMAQVRVLPHSLERIQRKQNTHSERLIKKRNWSQISRLTFPPKVTKLAQTLGNSLNPHDVYKTSVVAYLGKNLLPTTSKHGDNPVNKSQTCRPNN